MWSDSNHSVGFLSFPWLVDAVGRRSLEGKIALATTSISTSGNPTGICGAHHLPFIRTGSYRMNTPFFPPATFEELGMFVKNSKGYVIWGFVSVTCSLLVPLAAWYV